MYQVEEILARLIELRTDKKTKHPYACSEYICDVLRENDIIYKRLPLPDGTGENIIAGINVSELRDVYTGLVLSGHMDTVGVAQNAWKTNPFEAVVTDGRLYGRGAVDMKFFIAVVLSLLPLLKKAKYPIFLLFTGDEETDVQGIQMLTSFMEENRIMPKYALIGEPTHFDLCVANKGYIGYTTIVKGVAGHSSQPESGVNAVYGGAKIISAIEDLNNIYSSRGVTLNVGTVFGGEGRNSIPGEMRIDWEIRYFSEKDKDEVWEQLEHIFSDLKRGMSGIQIKNIVQESLPAFEYQENSRIAMVAHQILQSQILTFPLATEAGFLQKLGIDTLVCGAGDERLAHSSEEYILLSDLKRYQEFLVCFLHEMQREF